MFDDLDLLLLKEAAKKRKRARKRQLEWYRRLWRWIKARPERARKLIGRHPLSAAMIAALLGGGLGAGATYGLTRRSSLDDFVDDYDVDNFDWDYDDIIDELEKEAAGEEVAGGKPSLWTRMRNWLAARPERFREFVRGRPIQATLLATLLGGGLGAGTAYALSRRSSLDDLIDDLADEDLGLDYDDIEELEKEAALEELLEDVVLQELLE